MEIEEIREQLADLQHQQWSGWMQWMLEAKAHKLSGDIVIPGGLYDRWKRQMLTPYSELPEQEKESDRIEADKYLPLLTSAYEQGKRDMAESMKVGSITELEPISLGFSWGSKEYHGANQAVFAMIDQFNKRIDRTLAELGEGKGEK